MLHELKGYHTGWLYLAYCLFLISMTYFVQSFLLTESIFYNSYTEQLSFEQIEEVLEKQNKWKWVSYCVIPVLQAIKFFLVACCLLIGSLFFDIKLKFKEAFKAAILADLVFILPLIIKIFWFLIVQKDYTLKDLQSFSPLSTINIFNIETLDALWIYPLQTFSIFELFYIFALGFWVYQFGAKTYQKGLNMVLGSYLPGLFVWMILVMFVTVNLNPGI